MGELTKIYSGVQKKRAADDQARQMRHKAAARRAESGSESREEKRQGRIKMSRAQAVAAAGGGSLADPTIVNLMGDLEAESEYRALTRLYEGEEEARGLEVGAKGDLSSGVDCGGMQKVEHGPRRQIGRLTACPGDQFQRPEPLRPDAVVILVLNDTSAAGLESRP